MADRQKTIFDGSKLKLTAKPIEQGGRPPSLGFGTYMGNPQLSVFTGADNGSGVTFISAGYDPQTFYQLLDLIEELATNGSNGQSYVVETLTEIPKDKRTDPKQRLECKSITQVGRNDDGTIFISVQDARNSNAPKIQFIFTNNYYHRVKTINAQTDRGLESRLRALAWVRMLRIMVGNFLLIDPNAAADKAAMAAKFNNGGNKGNYGNKGGNSYGNGGGNKGYNKGGNGYNNNNGGGNSYGNKGNSNSNSGDGYSDGFDEDNDY